jgi:hypothetical protein
MGRMKVLAPMDVGAHSMAPVPQRLVLSPRDRARHVAQLVARALRLASVCARRSLVLISAVSAIEFSMDLAQAVNVISPCGSC